MPDVDEALAQAQKAIRAQKHAPPDETPDQRRRRIAGQFKAQQALVETSANIVAKLTGMESIAPVSDAEAKQLERPLKFKHVDMILDAIAAPIRENFKRLHARIAELEARPAVEYRGVYDNAKEYPAGSMVTDGGSMWHANASVKGVRPGDGAFWQLCVKRGKDARPK